MLAKLMGAIRGDKYMADAYPPAWRSAGDASTAAHVDRQDHDGNVRAATQARLDADRWIDEGGSLGSETTRPSRAAAAGHEQWSA